MREIEFRGLREDGEGFVYGSLIGKNVIVGDIVDFNEDYFTTEFWQKVIPETVGQYTGLKDKNGKKIFEEDILSDEVEVDGLIEKSKRQVFWNNKKGLWALDYSFDQDKSLSDSLYKELKIFEFEIIGNIHENKELLK